MYPMIIIGNTISFAGNPSIKESNIIPSIPTSLANGSKKFEQYARTLRLFIFEFAIIHIINPAGAATAMALPSTNIVRSKIERTNIFPICGLR